VEETASLAGAVRELRRQAEALRQAENRERALQSLPTPPEVANPAPLLYMIETIGRGARAVAAGRERVAALDRLALPADPPLDTSRIVEAVAELRRSERELAALRAKSRQADVSLEESRRAFESFSREMGGRCPLCGGELSAEAAIDHGHA